MRIATLVAFIVIAIGAFVFWSVTKTKNRLAAIKEYDVRQSKGYKEAKDMLRDLKEVISKKTGGSMVIDIIHDLGLPVSLLFDVDRDAAPKRITFEQAIDVMNAIRSTKKQGPIVVIVHTLGGYSLAAELIAAALKNHSGSTSVYVPYVAMSGGTLVAIAADKIHLGKNASLGPIGTLYWGYGFDAFKKLYDYKKNTAKDGTLLDYFEAEVSNRVERSRIEKVMNRHHEKRALDGLLDSSIPHDYRISFDDAGRSGIGLNVSDKCPNEIYQYVELRLLMIKKFEEAPARGQASQVAVA